MAIVTYKGGKYEAKYLDENLTDHIPGLRRLGGGVVEGPIDAINTALVRCGLPGTPKPLSVITPKEIPGARAYQNYGIAWLERALTLNQGAILADDMGLGKTFQTINTWSSMFAAGRNVAPFLIVCPASVRRTWAAQFRRWMPNITPYLLENGKQVEALDKLPNTPQVVVGGYELAQRLAATKFRPRMLALDEAHKLRGRVTKTSRAYWTLGASCNYRLALTGTPMWGRVRDMWSLLRTLFGYRFGNAEEFDYAYCNAVINKWGGRDNRGESRADELAERLSYVMLRRTKAEVSAEMPAITYNKRYVAPSQFAQLMLRKFVTKQGKFADALIATLGDKLAATIEVAFEANNAVIFTWRHDDVYALESMLLEAGRKVYTITGEQSDKQREAIILRAASENPKPYIVATLDSIGTGVDGLQHVSSNVIFHSMDPSPNKTLQGVSRVYRQGQTESVTATFMIMEDSADCLVESLVLDKMSQWETVMGKDDSASVKAVLDTTAVSSEAEEAALREMYNSL